MYWLGIDAGASSVKVVALDEEGRSVHAARRAHRGSLRACLRGMLDDLAALAPLGAGLSPDDCAGVVATGSGAELLCACAPGLPVLQDVPAIASGVARMAPRAASIIQMGAQSAVFVAAPDAAAPVPFAAGAPRFSMNESCAAGTGSFFEDQMERLGLPIEDYSRLVAGAQSVPRLSGRCSVFAKTDIIHRQQEGVPVEDILQGLCHATVKTYKATIVRNLPVARPVALVSGTLLNAGVVRAVREVLDLAEDELLADESLLFAQATGAALHARERGAEGAGEAIVRLLGARPAIDLVAGTGARAANARAASAPAASVPIASAPAESVPIASAPAAPAASAPAAPAASDDLPRLAPLPQVSCEPLRGYALAATPWNPAGAPGRAGGAVPTSPALAARAAVGERGPIPCALGVDVGSTSTNLVLVGLDGALLDAQYLRTRGNPKQAVREGLSSLAERVGDAVRVVAAGATGSGRVMIGEFIGADVVRDEITAQARAAAAADPLVDTVFEIGGQDSKYISLRAGQVVDFQMNKVCAAGTGSFVEEQAGRLGIVLADFGPEALSAKAPIDLGERCTVFVQTAINAALAKGASRADVAAGLCQSIVRNYLHKVVGTKPVGRRVVLQGGVAYNPGIVAAFRAYAGEGLTVSPWFAVSGAVGVALLALEAARAEEVAGAVPDAVSHVAATCEDIPFASAAGARSSFKGWDLSGAARVVRAADPRAIAENRAFFRRTDELFLEGYDPVRDPAKKTVGVPRCLMVHKLFPMINGFFTTLGYNVLLTDASNEETVRLAQQSTQGETCYPVKLVHGHMAQLLDAGVDYVFMPSMHTIRHASSTAAHNYACPYMQGIPAVVARELDYEGHGITLLNPLLNMDFGQNAMAQAMLEVGARLGHAPRETARAMMAGGFAVQEFTRKTEALGDELLAGLGPGERVMVIVTRNYGIVDPALNMGIPDLLLDRGQKVITISHLHAHDIDLQADHGDMYWPFGQHILSAAKLIARDPRLFAVYLTNHGCGPDTMVSHQVREEMGDKPYLQIEMDEHYSKVGVETRIEAFLNAIERYEARDLRRVPTSTRVVNLACTPVQRAEAPAGTSAGDASAEGAADAAGTSVAGAAGTVEILSRRPESSEGSPEGVEASAAALSDAATAAAAADAAGAAGMGGAPVAAPCAVAAASGGAGDADAAPAPDAASAPRHLERSEGSPEGVEASSFGGGLLSRDASPACPPVVGMPSFGPYGPLVAAWLRGADVPVRLLAPSAASLSLGRAETTSKEYYTFVSLLGLSLSACEGEAAATQLLLPGSLGGEADGQYARSIRAILDERGFGGVSVAAPTLELLPCTLEDPDGFFLRMLAGDVVWAAAPSARAGLSQRLSRPGLSLAGVVGAAREASASWGDVSAGGKVLFAVGEWPLVMGDELTGDLWPQLEREGYRVRRAPFAEYLWVLWEDARRESEHEKSTAPMPMMGERPAGTGAAGASGAHGSHGSNGDCAAEACDACSGATVVSGPALELSLDPLLRATEPTLPQDEWRARLARYADWLAQVSAALGTASAYAPDLDELLDVAREGVGLLAGANARYRYARAVVASRAADGVVMVASTYENIDTLLRLHGVPAACPLVSLSFDGVLDGGLEDRLRSFLYYL